MKKEVLEFLNKRIKWYDYTCEVDTNAQLSIQDTRDKLFNEKLKEECFHEIKNSLALDLIDNFELTEEQIEIYVDFVKQDIYDFVNEEFKKQMETLHEDIHFENDKCENKFIEDCLKEY